jgi:ABC-type polysaccharide/polyol phosphate export permease
MFAYLRSLWDHRDFCWSLVKVDLQNRYRGSMLGLGWSLLHPLLMTGLLCAVFHQLVGVSVREYAPFLLSGLAVWNYLVSATVQGCITFLTGEAFIRQYPAPAAVYPLRTAIGAMLHFLVALLPAVLLGWAARGLGNPLCLLSLVPTLALLFVLAWALATLAGFLHTAFRDTHHLLEVGWQMLFYATPVMYHLDVLGASPYRAVLAFNPLVAVLRLVRDPIVYGAWPPVAAFAVTTALVLTLAGAATLTVVRCERRLIFLL